MAETWFLYAPEAGEGASNFAVALERGTWGARSPGFFGGLGDGDAVVLAHGVRAGAKRVPRGFPQKNLIRGQPRLARLVRARVSGHQYLATSPLWPGDPYMFRFDFEVVSEKQDVVLFGGEIELPEAWAIWHSLRCGGRAFEATEEMPEDGAPRPRHLRWSREELILALDAAVGLGKDAPGPVHPAILALSDLLRKRRNLLSPGGAARGRTLQEVLDKVLVFLTRDPRSPEDGGADPNRAEEELWAEFEGERPRLARIAGGLKLRIRKGLQGDEALPGDEGEGRERGEVPLLHRAHLSRERNREAVDAARRGALRKNRRLSCEVCGFNFSRVYGARGAGFLEAHLRTPLSEIPPGARTKAGDLALLCANCHRMIHRRRPMLGVEELRGIVERRSPAPEV